MTCYFLLPHEIVEWVLSKASDTSDYFEMSNASRQRTFEAWKHNFGLVGHHAVACGLWGDAATFHTRDQMYLELMNIMTKHGHGGKRYRLCSFAKKVVCACGCFGRCTYDAVFAVLSWSFSQLLAGKYSSVRDDGKNFKSSSLIGDAWRSRVAGMNLKAKGGVIQKRGDWSWMKSALGLTSWTGEGVAKRCCYTCFANFTSHPFTDFCEFALWRLTCLTHTEYLNHCFAHGSHVSALFQIPGFDFANISVDLMHCLDLGVVQYLCGCALYDLFLELGGPESAPSEVLQYLLVLIKQAGKALAFSQPAVNKLSMSIIRTSGVPKMKTKASEGRKLLASLKYAFQHMVPQNSHHSTLRFHCIKFLAEVYEEMSAWSTDAGIRVAELGRKALVIYRELQMEDMQSLVWQRRGWALKMHQMQHCLRSKWLRVEIR